MGVEVTPMLATDPPETCQGCGTRPSTRRIETCPDVDDVDPADLFLCDTCQAELKTAMCGGTVTPGARGGKVGRGHPDQSKRAAANVESGTQQAALLCVVDQQCRAAPSLLNMENERFGTTCAEAAGPLSERVGHVVSRNQTATRMGELAEKSLVEHLKEGGRDVKRTTEGDNEGQVWVVTPAGHLEAARLCR